MLLSLFLYNNLICANSQVVLYLQQTATNATKSVVFAILFKMLFVSILFSLSLIVTK